MGSTGLQDYLNLPPTRAYDPIDLLLVVVFGLIGLVLALISGAMFRVAASLFGRFEGREVERALAAGIVFSAVGIFAPAGELAHVLVRSASGDSRDEQPRTASGRKATGRRDASRLIGASAPVRTRPARVRAARA